MRSVSWFPPTLKGLGLARCLARFLGLGVWFSGIPKKGWCLVSIGWVVKYLFLVSESSVDIELIGSIPVDR